MCHATSAGRKAGSVSTNKSQFVDTLSMNKAYQQDISYHKVFDTNSMLDINMYGDWQQPQII